MKKRLVFKDESSDKFWQIETQGERVTVTYGRTGTAGVTQVKEFPTTEKCEAEALKLVAEKIKKGYQDVNTENSSTNSKSEPNSSDQSYRATLETLAKSKDKQRALAEHFGYLSNAQDSVEMLASILSHVQEITVSKENELCLKLDLEDLYLVATPPRENINPKWPKSFLDCQKRHEFVTLTNRKNLTHLTLGDTGTLDRSELAENMESEKFKKVISPVSEMSDWWIYHPTEKTESGDPLIYFVDHEDIELGNSQTIGPGALFIKRCLEILANEKVNHNKSSTDSVTIQAIFGSGLRYFVDNVNILEILDTRLQRLRFDQGEIIRISSTDDVTINAPIAIHFTRDTALVRGTDRLNVFIIDENRIRKSADIPFSNAYQSIVCYQGHLFFYDPEIKSFTQRSISNTYEETHFRKDQPNENLDIKDTTVVNDILIFGEKRFLFGFTRDINTSSVNEVFKMRTKTPNTKLIAVPNSSFLIVINLDLITFYQIEKMPMVLVGEKSRGAIEAYSITENSFIALSKHMFETSTGTVTVRQITVFSVRDFPRLELRKDVPLKTPSLENVSNIARYLDDLFLIAPHGTAVRVANFFT